MSRSAIYLLAVSHVDSITLLFTAVFLNLS